MKKHHAETRRRGAQSTGTSKTCGRPVSASLRLCVTLLACMAASGCVVMPPESNGDGSVTVQVVLYQRGGSIAAPTGENETLSETATSGGGKLTAQADEVDL